MLRKFGNLWVDPETVEAVRVATHSPPGAKYGNVALCGRPEWIDIDHEGLVALGEYLKEQNGEQ